MPVRVAVGTGHEDRIMENRRLRLANGKEADVRHAYALTGHASQGATVDRAFVLAPMRSAAKEWGYVALSRARVETSMYAWKQADPAGDSVNPATPTQGVAALPYYGLAAGFLTGRKNQICWMHGQDQTLSTGEDDGRFVLNVITTIEESSRSVADVKTAIGSLKTRKEVGILEGHNFAAASGTNTWSRENLEELFAWLYSERAAESLEIKSQSRWYADLTGRACSLR